jgi:hypothetical protein
MTQWQTEHGVTVIEATCTCGVWKVRNTSDHVVLNAVIEHEVSNLAFDIASWKETH